MTLNTWLNANAQTSPAKPTAPKYTKLQDANNFSIKGNGKAFQPGNLQQANKPDKADDKEFQSIAWQTHSTKIS